MRQNPDEYGAFLRAKELAATQRGLAQVPPLAAHLFPFQRIAVEFGLKAGAWGLFFDTGLGKTACELEWSRHAIAASNGYGLILAPLAVAWQIANEGRRWGYDVHQIRRQDDARPGINVCNYDRMHELDPQAFGAVVLDESSILKNFVGKQARELVTAFAGHRWRMAATATPAPNDHVELGQHADFLGVLSRDEMLVRWFLNDSNDTGTWRLKKHAAASFWSWMASWSRMAEHPRDMGDDQPGFDLPRLEIVRHHAAPVEWSGKRDLFGASDVSATGIHEIKRATAEARAKLAATVVTGEPGESWVVWCDTDYEADALAATLPDAEHVKGSMTVERKESTLERFAAGACRVLITKPSICGFGLNWQHCARMLFVGRTFSYESWYQAVRRCWRFGQQRPVNAHLIVADGEDAIGRVLARKGDDHDRMKREMVAAMRLQQQGSQRRVAYQPKHNGRVPSWL